MSNYVINASMIPDTEGGHDLQQAGLEEWFLIFF